jgi:guanylate kinase
MNMKSLTAHLVVICAPSGTGKSTLLERLKLEYPKLQWSVSCTTRPIRAGERDGVDYHFISKEKFEALIAENDFIEWAKVHSNYYGTSKSFVNRGLDQNISMLFDLDVQGADAMKKIYQSTASVIFIKPPSLEALEARLKGRGTDSLEVIKERLKNARNELTRANDYDYLITNDDVERAYGELKSIVGKLLEHH